MNTKKILIADDDQDLLFQMELYVKKHSVYVHIILNIFIYERT